MEDKNTIKTYFKDLWKSIFKTKNLFKFAFYKWYTPFIIFAISAFIITLPTIVSYKTLELTHITSNNLFIDKVLVDTLKDDIKCSIVDAKLVCDDNYSYREKKIVEDENMSAVYMVYVNYDISAESNFSVGNYGEHFDSDNYLIFFKDYFTYRYTTHNPKDKTVDQSILIGMYSDLEGTNFHQIYENSLTNENPDKYLSDTANSILLTGYKSFAKEGIYTAALSNVALYLVFILIIGLLIKGNYLLRKSKGFKYTQAIKIATVASLQSLLITIPLTLFGLGLVNAFALSLAIRALFIYIRYTGSSKNTDWLKEIYEYSKDERFNI